MRPPSWIRATVQATRDGWHHNISHDVGSGDFTAKYILATPEALAAAPEVQALIQAGKADILDSIATLAEIDGATEITVTRLKRMAADIRKRETKP